MVANFDNFCLVIFLTKFPPVSHFLILRVGDKFIFSDLNDLLVLIVNGLGGHNWLISLFENLTDRFRGDVCLKFNRLFWKGQLFRKDPVSNFCSFTYPFGRSSLSLEDED